MAESRDGRFALCDTQDMSRCSPRFTTLVEAKQLLKAWRQAPFFDGHATVAEWEDGEWVPAHG